MGIKKPWCFVLTAVLLLSCQKLRNSDFPTPPQELTRQHVWPELLSKKQKWVGVADALRIGTNSAATREELIQQLATPSELLTLPEHESQLAALRAKMKTHYLQSTQKLRCERIVSVEEHGTAFSIDLSSFSKKDVSAKSYILKYASVDEPDVVRSGFVVLPNSGQSPLLAYAHGGDNGLAYFELAAVLGDEQERHVVVAPTYPAEPLCAFLTGPNRSCGSLGFLAEAVGSESLFDGDANELLAMRHCVVRAGRGEFGAIAVQKSTSPGDDFANLLAQRLSFPSGQQEPHSLVVGASRGGQVTLMALAKAGALREEPESDKPVFDCAATFAGPATVVTGETRLALEHYVLGTAKSTRFYSLPGGKYFQHFFEAYRNGEEDSNTVAARLAALDGLFAADFIFDGLNTRATANTSKGTLAVLHGEKDSVVGFSQSQIAMNYFSQKIVKALEDNANPPIQLLYRAFKPNDADLSSDGTLRNGVSQHMDLAFSRSVSYFPEGISGQAILDKSSGINLSPMEVFKLWRNEETNGCAAKLKE